MSNPSQLARHISTDVFSSPVDLPESRQASDVKPANELEVWTTEAYFARKVTSLCDTSILQEQFQSPQNEGSRRILGHKGDAQ